MNRKAMVLGAGLLGMAGCSSQTTGSYRGAAGTLASSQDGSLVYAVDTDNQQVVVVDSKSFLPVTTIPVGAKPSRITVGLDDKIYVSNRGERTVSVISKSNFQEITRIPVGVEPMGLSLSDDGTELYVVSSTDLNDPSHGTLTAIDTTSLQAKWQTPVGEEPRGVAVANGKAYVTNFKAGTLTEVDLTSRSVAKTISLNNSDDPDPTTNPGSASVGNVIDVAASPDGSRVYVPHVWLRNGAIQFPVGSPGGYYQQGGPCGIGAIVSPGVGTVQTSDDTNLVDSFSACAAAGGFSDTSVNYPPSAIWPDRSSDGVTPAHVFQGPTVAVVDPTNSWLFVANRESNNIVVLATSSRVGTEPTDTNVSTEIELTDSTVSGGGVPDSTSGVAPDGLLISKDGKTLFAYSQLGHELEVIQQNPADTGNALDLVVVSRSKLASDPASLTPDQIAGRQMFYSAVDLRISSIKTGIACASCHVDGREDGHTWVFPDGPRRTPELAGRDLAATAPYHWTGIFPLLQDFYNETLIKRMGGTGLSANDAAPLTSYVESLPAVENPLQNRPDLANTMAVGRAAFESSGCIQCHSSVTINNASPDLMTDNLVHNVGTITGADLLENTEDQAESPPLTSGFNTPSLLGIGRTAPYLHDGQILTLSQRVAASASADANGNFLHGNTKQLTSTQAAALVTYLSSL